jgi:hypothetical protein
VQPHLRPGIRTSAWIARGSRRTRAGVVRDGRETRLLLPLVPRVQGAPSQRTCLAVKNSSLRVFLMRGLRLFCEPREPLAASLSGFPSLHARRECSGRLISTSLRILECDGCAGRDAAWGALPVASDARWFQGAADLKSGFVKGRFDQMIVIRHNGGELPLQNHLEEIILDDPKHQDAEGTDTYSQSVGALRFAMSEGQLDVPIRRRKCSHACGCTAAYTNQSQRRKMFDPHGA